MTKFTIALLSTIFLSLSNWAQECSVSKMSQEYFDQKGVSRILYEYSFSYRADGKLNKIDILESGISNKEGNKHLLVFEEIELGTKITWFWDGEYERHLVITGNGILSFEGESESELNPDYADLYPLTFDGRKLKFDEENGKTFIWEDDVITKTVRVRGTVKHTTEYTYSDVPNPFYGLLELGLIDIAEDYFTFPFYTLPSKLWATEKHTFAKNGVEQPYTKTHAYTHTLNANGCVGQFTVHESDGQKEVYTFTY